MFSRRVFSNFFRDKTVQLKLCGTRSWWSPLRRVTTFTESVPLHVRTNGWAPPAAQRGGEGGGGKRWRVNKDWGGKKGKDGGDSGKRNGEHEKKKKYEGVEKEGKYQGRKYFKRGVWGRRSCYIFMFLEMKSCKVLKRKRTEFEKREKWGILDKMHRKKEREWISNRKWQVSIN